MTTVAPPILENPTEFSVEASWKAVEGATAYKLIVRQLPKPWEESKSLDYASDVLKTTLEELEPASAYQVKVVAVTAAGEQESLPANVDTLIPDCTPNRKCAIL